MSKTKERKIVNNFGIDKEIEGDYLKWNYFWNLFQLENLKYQNYQKFSSSSEKYFTSKKTLCSEIFFDSIKKSTSFAKIVGNYSNTSNICVDLSTEIDPTECENTAFITDDESCTADTLISSFPPFDNEMSIFLNDSPEGGENSSNYPRIMSKSAKKPPLKSFKTTKKVVKNPYAPKYNLSHFTENYFPLFQRSFFNNNNIKDNIKKVKFHPIKKSYSFEDVEKNGVEITKTTSTQFKWCKTIEKNRWNWENGLKNNESNSVFIVSESARCSDFYICRGLQYKIS